MRIKYLKMVLLITAIPLLFGASCNKDDGTSCPANYTTYSFNATATISPQQVTYHIGDTIFYNSTLTNPILDKFSNQLIDYTNAVLPVGDNGINLIDTITKQFIPARDSFNLIAIIGSFIEEPNNLRAGINLKYQAINNSYKFSGGFICKKKGIYTFGVGDLLSSGINGKNCTKATFLTLLDNTNTSGNIQLYQYASGVTPTAEGAKRIYCFRVQ